MVRITLPEGDGRMRPFVMGPASTFAAEGPALSDAVDLGVVTTTVKSGRTNGIDRMTGQRWFTWRDTIFEVYRMKTDSR